ncbi:hypothetical protein G4177_01520 [Corallococcus sp. ZKHCc1 1396]|uniref:Uncharacterized protein n=1 Tax=Corallococcus soli TaxID=2710757 RepID=A0ABR9PG10_9BACT|nr:MULTISPECIES: hypothetical protein [Corallococcus]MBE4746851.1 hypothetical protein [Corallococcus soli]MCY1030401.1 hypothetical protein [Corallococcus sp. BB11-1]
MSDKDVLHIPLEGLPPVPERQAGTEEEERERTTPPILNPDGGPGDGPGVSHNNPRIIEPVSTPRPYPGVSVT